MPLLKEVGKLSIRISKTELRQGLNLCKLSLSPAELDNFANKCSNCITYCKRRLRDAGSGARLPKFIHTLVAIWQRHHGKRRSTSQKKKRKAKGQEATNEMEETKQKDKEDTKQEDKEDTKQKRDIRSVFGLPAKVVDQVDVPSSSESNAFLDEVSNFWGGMKDAGHTPPPRECPKIISNMTL